MKTPYLKYQIKQALVFLFVYAMGTQAALASSWALDPSSSSINFFSVKKGSIGESHRFTDFSGEVKGSVATVVIMPDSVDSKVPIRNERMREFLFKTKAYPTIEISADLSKDIMGMAQGVSSQTVPASLSMHGEKKAVNLDVMINHSGDQVTVTSVSPVIIKSSDYGMLAGVQKLGELVGGIDIASSVPVNFSLVFKQN